MSPLEDPDWGVWPSPVFQPRTCPDINQFGPDLIWTATSFETDGAVFHGGPPAIRRLARWAIGAPNGRHPLVPSRPTRFSGQARSGSEQWGWKTYCPQLDLGSLRTWPSPISGALAISLWRPGKSQWWPPVGQAHRAVLALGLKPLDAGRRANFRISQAARSGAVAGPGTRIGWLVATSECPRPDLRHSWLGQPQAPRGLAPWPAPCLGRWLPRGPAAADFAIPQRHPRAGISGPGTFFSGTKAGPPGGGTAGPLLLQGAGASELRERNLAEHARWRAARQAREQSINNS